MSDRSDHVASEEAIDVATREQQSGRGAGAGYGLSPASGEGVSDTPLSASSKEARALEADIVLVLQRIYDPEIPVNIYDLGLIYGIDVYPLGRVTVRMTLTSPACPVAGSLPPEVEQAVRSVEGVSDATVELVWDPPWTMDRMSEEAKLELNLL